MKTRTYGIGPFGMHSRSIAVSVLSHSSLYAGPDIAAVENYKDNRNNGSTADNPDRPFPKTPNSDYEWERETDYPNDLPGEEKPRENYYRVKYTESLDVKAWMEEKDTNYITRVIKESEHRDLTEQERQDIEEMQGLPIAKQFLDEQQAKKKTAKPKQPSFFDNVVKSDDSNPISEEKDVIEMEQQDLFAVSQEPLEPGAQPSIGPASGARSVGANG